MQQINLTLVAKQTLNPTMWHLILEAEQPLSTPKPGQFYLMQSQNPFDAYLQRAIFPFSASGLMADVVAENSYHLILTATHLTDPSLAWLISRRVGDILKVLGPLGHGFNLEAPIKNLLLIGSGADVGPLFGLAEMAIKASLNVVLALEVVKKMDLYPTHTLPPAVEIRLASLDGSLGHQGEIIDALGELGLWADAVCAIGSLAFYKKLKDYLSQKRLLLNQGFAQVLIIHPHLNVCGRGICTFCPVFTAKGMKLACYDGPVFDLAELQFG